MIEMKAGDHVITLKPLDQSRLVTATKLYNCSDDIRYATGIVSPVSCFELAEMLERIQESKNEFLAGIYIADAYLETFDCQAQLAGVVSGILQGKTLWIKLMAILPQLRRRGIGSRSSGLLLQYSKAYYGTTEALLSVISKNDAGMRFWHRQGFTEAIRFNKALFNGEQPYEVVIMHIRL